MIDRTVCELFAGVGGFRCGLNSIKGINETEKNSGKPERWKTVYFSQWEPADKKTQWAHDCYVNRFGTCQDLNGVDTTNYDINTVDKDTIPEHNLLVGGFPCQDYSVASSLASSKGLEGKKGVLWWDIRDTLEAKSAPFVLLENVDRLLKSPASQRGRDFGVILACFRDLGYTVEWRVINAADYGYQQRRRRTFIFAYRNDTHYAGTMPANMEDVLLKEGFFAKSFPVIETEAKLKTTALPAEVGEVSKDFHFLFENSGIMTAGVIYTAKTTPRYAGKQITLGDIMEAGDVAEKFFIPKDRLYYAEPEVQHSDETEERLPEKDRKTWQYIKGGKRLLRKSASGHEYVFSEGPISMIDEYDKPARTMLTSEGSFNRSTHIVRDKKTGKIRLLTPIEAERIQGFPDDWTRECLVNGETVEMPLNKRRFMMGNALVVNLIEQMEQQLSEIFDNE